MIIIIIAFSITSLFELSHLDLGPAALPGGPDRPRPTHFDPCTWSLRVARRVVPVAPSRSKALDRAASSDQSRLKRSPERPRDVIFDDFGSIWGPISEVFRGCIARATRLKARRAEPLFLLAGAVLQRVRRLSEKARSRRKSSKIGIGNASRSCCTGNTRFFRFQTCFGIDFGRFGVLPDAPGCSLWHSGAPLWNLWALSGRTEDSPRRSRDAPETLPRRSRDVPRSVRDALGRPGPF